MQQINIIDFRDCYFYCLLPNKDKNRVPLVGTWYCKSLSYITHSQYCIFFCFITFLCISKERMKNADNLQIVTYFIRRNGKFFLWAKHRCLSIVREFVLMPMSCSKRDLFLNRSCKYNYFDWHHSHYKATG